MSRTISSLKQRIALVTGGNRGIGKEITRQLALQGYRVLIGCRDGEKGEKVVTEMHQHGLNVDLQVVDIEYADSVKQAIIRIKKRVWPTRCACE